jgi:hypothetical protein
MMRESFILSRAESRHVRQYTASGGKHYCNLFKHTTLLRRTTELPPEIDRQTAGLHYNGDFFSGDAA